MGQKMESGRGGGGWGWVIRVTEPPLPLLYSSRKILMFFARAVPLVAMVWSHGLLLQWGAMIGDGGGGGDIDADVSAVLSMFSWR